MNWAQTTFEPFQWDGAWFALYSPDYTTTRVMSLPDCRDIGGEEPSLNGFCPVEFYAPRYREIAARLGETPDVVRFWEFDNALNDSSVGAEYEAGEWLNLPTAFVAGCQWGDDTSWKLECIDLGAAAQGQIVRTRRFGHVELAKGRTLIDSLRFDRHPPLWDLRATIIRQERRDVATGELIHPYDE